MRDLQRHQQRVCCDNTRSREFQVIAVIDYGIGNLRSVKKALDYLNIDSKVVSTGAELEKGNFKTIILPGVGAFGATVKALKERGLSTAIKDSLYSGAFFLGICIGLQILFEASDEDPSEPGLEIFKGRIKKLPAGLRVPQMQWNLVEFRNSRYFNMNSEWFYFVHSYYLDADSSLINPKRESKYKTYEISGVANYGVSIAALIEAERIIAVQFHPEKSGQQGLKFLKDFVESSLLS